MGTPWGTSAVVASFWLAACVGPAPTDDGTEAVHVLAGSEGDGSAEAPYGAIVDALVAAAERDPRRVVIGAGAHP